MLRAFPFIYLFFEGFIYSLDRRVTKGDTEIVRETEMWMEMEIDSICWFTPNNSRIDQGWVRLMLGPERHMNFPCEWQELRTWAIICCFLRSLGGICIARRTSRTQAAVSTQDAGSTSGNSSHCTTMPAPGLFFYFYKE